MRNFTTALVIVIMLIAAKAKGQSIDSLKFDFRQNYDSELPPISFDLNNLPTPTLFILDDKKLKIKKYSELKIARDKIESTIIIQNKEELKKMNYADYNSVVILKSKE
jgi:hypothetical protein